MIRIDALHLAWVLDELVEGRVVNRITVDPVTREWAKVALDRMPSITYRARPEARSLGLASGPFFEAEVP